MNQSKFTFPTPHVPKIRLSKISTFINNPHYLLPIRLLFLTLGLSFLLLGITFKKLPPIVPLYYSLPWGDEQLARTSELFIIPFSVMLILILNFFISMLLLKKDQFLTQLLLWASLALSVAGLITLSEIIFLVI